MTFDIIEVEKTRSTNDDIRKLAAAGYKEGTVVSANEQSCGRGTKGRSFISLKGGLYFSLLLRPKKADCITAMAAVAVLRALKKETGAPVGIKWTNDIYLCGKKICGILCESAFSNDSEPDFVVLGIGINLSYQHFTKELDNIATSLEKEGYSFDKKALLNRILCEFDDIYSVSKDWLDDYRKYSVILGKKITVIGHSESYEALAAGIDEEGHLNVKKENGDTVTLFSGEISVRLSKKDK